MDYYKNRWAKSSYFREDDAKKDIWPKTKSFNRSAGMTDQFRT